MNMDIDIHSGKVPVFTHCLPTWQNALAHEVYDRAINNFESSEEEIRNNENYAFIENYVVIIRGKISGGNYNPDYIAADGTTMDIVIQKFSSINNYYYEILQGKHYEHLVEQLDTFAASQSYIEKQGIISYIQRYFDKQDVQFTVALTCANDDCASCGVEYNGSVDTVARPTCPVCGEVAEDYRLTSDNDSIAKIINRFVAYETELDAQEGYYTELLEQNTRYFLNAVKKFDTAITYADKLALLNEAMPFYYAMNVGSADVQDAIAKYDALDAELRLVQNKSRAFIEYVLLLPAALAEEGMDGYYRTLVSAAALRDEADKSIDGVLSAISAYESELAAYEAVTNTVNKEIKESATVLGTLGANCGFTSVLSVVLNKLFSF